MLYIHDDRQQQQRHNTTNKIDLTRQASQETAHNLPLNPQTTHSLTRCLQQENGMVSIKLGDFGLATQMESTRVMKLVAGTPAYIAPEVVGGGGIVVVDLDVLYIYLCFIFMRIQMSLSCTLRCLLYVCVLYHVTYLV